MESSNLNEEVLSKWDDVWPHFTMAVKQHRFSQWNLQTLTIVSNSVLFHCFKRFTLWASLWWQSAFLVYFTLASVLEHFEHLCDEKVEIWGIVSNLVLFHSCKRFYSLSIVLFHSDEKVWWIWGIVSFHSFKHFEHLCDFTLASVSKHFERIRQGKLNISPICIGDSKT